MKLSDAMCVATPIILLASVLVDIIRFYYF